MSVISSLIANHASELIVAGMMWTVRAILITDNAMGRLETRQGLDHLYVKVVYVIVFTLAIIAAIGLVTVLLHLGTRVPH